MEQKRFPLSVQVQEEFLRQERIIEEMKAVIEAKNRTADGLARELRSTLRQLEEEQRGAELKDDHIKRLENICHEHDLNGLSQRLRTESTTAQPAERQPELTGLDNLITELESPNPPSWMPIPRNAEDYEDALRETLRFMRAFRGRLAKTFRGEGDKE